MSKEDNKNTNENQNLTPEQIAELELKKKQDADATKKAEAELAKKQKEAKAEIEAKAKRLFKSFQKAEVLYFTADGVAFMSENDAKNHAKSLDETNVQTIKRK